MEDPLLLLEERENTEERDLFALVDKDGDFATFAPYVSTGVGGSVNIA